MKLITSLLDMIFNGCITVMMFICFFSLSSNMSANLLEQQKEIGILRSIGVSKIKIRLLFFYEAFVLVLSACILGVFTGSTIGFTMSMQQTVLTGIPLKFVFPWNQLWLILALSILLAFLATFGPATQITRQEIAQIFRGSN